MTHRIRRFLPLLWCLLLALSLLGCAGPLIQSGPYVWFLPSRAHVEADKVSLAISADLRAKLNAILAQSCKTADNNRPDPQLVAQTYRDPAQELQLKLLAAVLGWAMEPPPELRVAVPPTRQLIPLPPTEWQPAVPVPAAEAPPLIEHPVVQFGAGAVAGGAIGAVPFGPLGAEIGIELRVLPNGTYWARVGKACGEIVIGTGQMILGGAGMSAGAGMCSTGGGAPAGVLVVSGSYAIAANGCLTAGHGAVDGYRLLRDGNVPSTSSAPAPAPPRLVLKKAPKKPTQAPVAEAAPAAKPAQPTTPQQTTTRTVYKDSSGKPIKTVTKTGQTTTTTWDKGNPAATGTPATPVAKGAKRGPKTDPDAPHNAAVRAEADKLRAQGNTIVAGGGGGEKVVEITGGIKTLRRPDITYRTPDGKLRGRNVGKTNADGTPVKREVEALDDLNNHSETPTDFVAYDR